MIERKGIPWSEEEDELLRNLAPSISVVRLAARLGRSEGGVRNRANKLRVRLRIKKRFGSRN
jgi:hypothetical protein